MRILELELTNFKGVRSFLLELNGNDAVIRGDNATGKTTVMDAFIWLLTGKDHLGRTDYKIEPLDEEGRVIPLLESTVRALMEYDGSQIGFVRVYKGIWKPEAGGAEVKSTGHKTEFFINGVTKLEKDYQALIDRIVPPQLLKLFIMPGYFCEQIKPDERRKMLIDMCGDISDADILVRPEFSGLTEHVGKFVTVSELKEQKAKEKTRINNQLKEIPVRIDTHTKYLGVELTASVEHVALDRLTKEIEANESAKAALYSGEAIAQLRRDLIDLKAAKNQAEVDAVNRCAAQKNVLRRRIEKAEDEIAVPMSELAKLSMNRKPAEEAVAKLKKQKDRLWEEYKRIDAQEFSADATCPTCGQEMPESVIEDARARFNEDKANRLEENVREGKLLAADIEAREKQLQENAARMDVLRAEIKKLTKAKKVIEDELLAVPFTVDFGDELITAKQAEIDEFNASVEDRANKLSQEIERLKGEKAVHEQNLAKLANAENAEKEIEKLKVKEKDLSAAFDECEQVIALCDDFGRAKVELLDSKISGAFRFTQFKLTETLLNGGTKEICDALIGGVPYSAANNAARINCGLDIIETFSQAYGVTLPIFIDNAESVTWIYPMDSVLDRPQIIRLVVSAEHKKLTMEAL